MHRPLMGLPCSQRDRRVEAEGQAGSNAGGSVKSVVGRVARRISARDEADHSACSAAARPAVDSMAAAQLHSCAAQCPLSPWSR